MAMTQPDELRITITMRWALNTAPFSHVPVRATFA